MGSYLYNDFNNDFKHDEDSLINELINESPYDEMEKTLELDALPLDEEEKALLEDKPKELPKTKKKKLLPWTVAEKNHLEHAFVHCSILGFITAFMGAGWLTFIINHI